MHADMTAAPGDIVATWPEAAQPRQVHRVRGCVHKVIRWAFEEQGLDSTFVGARDRRGPTPPSLVDLFIADGRARPGSYDPVPLDVPVALPAWHATGIVLSAAGVEVTVGNLGSAAATDVSVKCWALSTSGGGATPGESTNAWKELDASPGQLPDSVAARGSAIFSFLPKSWAAGPCWASTTSRLRPPARPTSSNLDPTMMTTGLISAVTPLADLVANDNNLGLRALQFV